MQDGKSIYSVKARPEGDLALGGYTLFNLGAIYRSRPSGRDLTLRAR